MVRESFDDLLAFIVGAPAHFARRPPPQTPQDLAGWSPAFALVVDALRYRG